MLDDQPHRSKTQNVDKLLSTIANALLAMQEMKESIRPCVQVGGESRLRVTGTRKQGESLSELPLRR
jgi:hypothetical protein